MSTDVVYQIADSLKAALEALDGGPLDGGLSLAFDVAVREIPSHTPEQLRAKPIVSIVPRGFARAKIGRGGWTKAPTLAILVQKKLATRLQASEPAKQAAEVAELRALADFADELEREICGAYLANRQVAALTYPADSYFVDHLLEKRIWSRFLVVNFDPQLDDAPADPITAPTPRTGVYLRRPAGESFAAPRAGRVVDGAIRVARQPDGERPDGVLLDAAASGVDAYLYVDGPIEDDSWSWSIGPVYTSGAGVLTQSLPTSGLVFEVGRAIGPTTLWVDPQPGYRRRENETPAGPINGVNATFTLSVAPVPESLQLFLNGQRLALVGDYTLSGAIVQLVTAPSPDESLVCVYERA